MRLGSALALSLLATACLSVPPRGDGDECVALFGDVDAFELCMAAPDRCSFVAALADESCRAYCSTQGSECIASHDPAATASCDLGAATGCEAIGATRHCVCGTATSACTVQFGRVRGYQLCVEETDRCTFHVDSFPATTSCTDVCAQQGGACLGEADSEPEAPCTAIERDPSGCDTPREEHLCTCSK